MTYDPNSGSTGSSGSTGTPSSSDRAGQVASSVKESATEQGRHTASVASDELHSVAAEVTSQARDLFGELRTQVDEQASTQKQRLSEALRTFTHELQQMADSGGSSGIATEVVRQIATRAQGLQSTIDDNEPADLLTQGRHYARRRPGAFLLGALTAGVVAGRITRGSKSTVGSSRSTTPVGTAASMPAAQPPIGLTRGGTGYGEQTFEPSGYEPGYAGTGTTTGIPATPATGTGRPYSGGGVQ